MQYNSMVNTVWNKHVEKKMMYVAKA